MAEQPRARPLRRVLVTRPEPGATATVGRLAEMGFLPLKLPLHETLPLPVQPILPLEGIVATAVPSASAIRHAPRPLIERLAALPCFAVGAATAKVAREAGFLDVVEAQGDAESLAATIIAHGPDGRIAYLCGRVRRPVFQKRMAYAGIAVLAIETYDTVEIGHAAGAMTEALGGEHVDYALVYSANAAAFLARIAAMDELKGRFASTTLVCISPRVAEAAAGAGGKIAAGKIIVAAEPAEHAMLTMLRGDGGNPT